VLWLDRVVFTLLCKELCSGVLERHILSTTSSFLSISEINNTITVSIPPLSSFFLSVYYLLVAVCINFTRAGPQTSVCTSSSLSTLDDLLVLEKLTFFCFPKIQCSQGPTSTCFKLGILPFETMSFIPFSLICPTL